MIGETRRRLREEICATSVIEHVDIRALNVMLHWGKGSAKDLIEKAIRGVARSALRVAGVAAHYNLENIIAEVEWPLLQKIKFNIMADWGNYEKRRVQVTEILRALVRHAPRLEVIRVVLDEWGCEVNLGVIPGFTCVWELHQPDPSKRSWVHMTWERDGRRRV